MAYDGFVSDNSPIFQELNIPVLLNTYIKEEESQVIIYVSHDFLKDKLKIEYNDKLERFFNKSISYSIDPQKFEKQQETQTPVSFKKGYVDGPVIIQEGYLDPYFTSKNTNQIAVSMGELVHTKTAPTILFLYGPTSVGKSHLFHIICRKAYENGKKIFYREASTFMDLLNKLYGSGKDQKRVFTEEYKDFDIYVIDDIQIWQERDNTTWATAELFKLIQMIINSKKVLMVSSDKHPSLLTKLEDRIKTRLVSDLATEMKEPDHETKEKFLRYRIERDNIKFIDDEHETKCIQYACSIGQNFRMLLGLIGTMNSLFLNGPVSFEAFAVKAGETFEEKIRKSLQPLEFRALHELLREYFEEDPNNKNRQRKSRKADSTCFYLLVDKVGASTLRKLCNIDAKHQAYFMQRGQQCYESIDDEEILYKIKMIVGS